ncbi:Rrf2 family transcriptional regulator [Benzoatithermus flavus]|uniref:Rrf2 family transcriptional regulator n=1 Tax=Benzoatithermus flavus TaxID=3108223 RepID=A0ABU8XTG0_9PROT
MRLTRHTDFALRVLIFLGLCPNRLASIREIAEAYGISENHLVKVVHGLGRAGFVETLRGRGGGLRLARPPEAIRIGDVVRRTEEDLALVDCFPPAGRSPHGGEAGAAQPVGCAIGGCCRLQTVLEEALAAFFAVLDRTTLADLLPQPDREAIVARLRLLVDEPREPARVR